jgi:nucleoside-diphosphate-sugar epimerase
VKVILFGASGMIGQGVLRECVMAADVETVLSISRHTNGKGFPKVGQLAVPDLRQLGTHGESLNGYDACFFCAGVSAVGMSEADYARVTYDLTLAAAKSVLATNPAATFIYVSGQGTDSTEHGRAMWARVKGRTENALLPLSSRTFMFRPGLIVPKHGIRSRTGWYNIFYAATKPLNPVFERYATGSVTTTERMGRAMLAVARRGYDKRILETSDINLVALP